MTTRWSLFFLPLACFSFYGCSSEGGFANDWIRDPSPARASEDEKDQGDAVLESGDAGNGDAGSDDDLTGLDGGDAGSLPTCGKAGAAVGFAQKTINVGGVDRSYLIFVPSSYVPNKPLTLVVGLHGMTGTATKARNMFGLGMETESAGKAIFVYPQALPSTEPEFLGKTRWNVTAGTNDHAFIEALMTAMETKYCIDKKKEFAVGFSNGAEMVTALGCSKGDRYRAIAPVATGLAGTEMLSSKTCVGEVAVWTGVGTEDTNHLEGAAVVRDYYRAANGCSATTIATLPTGCRAYQGCRSGVPTTTCSYTAAHTWPTFGSTAVWAFFDQFQ